MQTVILYFGSFNPVHNGHIALAKAVAERYEAEVWFVLSPQNPFKQDRNLWPEETRVFLLKKALENKNWISSDLFRASAKSMPALPLRSAAEKRWTASDLFRASAKSMQALPLRSAAEKRFLRFCDVELRLSKPSYTINTLRHLQTEEPQTRFLILMGEDNLAGLHKWREIDEIMARCRILVYPRKEGTAPPQALYPVMERFADRITLLKDLPLLDISSTEIRQMIAEGKDISALVPWPAEALEKWH